MFLNGKRLLLDVGRLPDLLIVFNVGKVCV